MTGLQVCAVALCVVRTRELDRKKNLNICTVLGARHQGSQTFILRTRMKHSGDTKKLQYCNFHSKV